MWIARTLNQITHGVQTVFTTPGAGATELRSFHGSSNVLDPLQSPVIALRDSTGTIDFIAFIGTFDENSQTWAEHQEPALFVPPSTTVEVRQLNAISTMAVNICCCWWWDPPGNSLQIVPGGAE